MHPTERSCIAQATPVDCTPPNGRYLTKLVAYKDALELVTVLPGERGHTGNCPHPPCVLCGEEPREESVLCGEEPREESVLCGYEPREESVFV